MILPAVEQLQALARNTCEGNQLEYSEIIGFSTPRRLAVQLKGLPDSQPDRVLEMKGPPANIAKDPQGNWSKAAIGFARKQGVTAEMLEIREFQGKDYLYTMQNVKGLPVPELLTKHAPSWVSGLNFPKNMRWGGYHTRFVRPIRWLVSLWNEQALPFEIEMVNADRFTRGHRFLHREPFSIKHAEQYESLLRDLHVIANYQTRRGEIVDQVHVLEQKKGFQVRLDDKLLEEVTNLVEWPTLMHGDFEQDFLELPEPVLVTSMAVHQRYFPVYENSDSEAPRLLPHFVAVRNGDSRSLETVCRGNARVLRARLSDARFFFHEDQKSTPEEYNTQLEQVVFFQNRGNQRERVSRIRRLSGLISEKLGLDDSLRIRVDRIAELCKFDLQTQMIGEFPELQGVMGAVYAALKEEAPETCRGIREHYFPRNAQDRLPGDMETVPVSLADRLDMLAAAFSLNMAPSGSADPYALRRMAQGVVQIILGLGLKLDWNELVEQAIEGLREQHDFVTEPTELQQNMVDFLLQRERWYLQEQGVRYDLIEALLKTPSGLPLQRLRLAEIMNPELNSISFKKTVEAVVRAINISSKYADEIGDRIETKLLSLEEEHDFSGTLTELGVDGKADKPGSATDFMRQIYRLEPVITRFFDGVMVMDEDKGKRRNRLRLCSNLADWSLSHLDLREIIFPGEQ